MPECIICSDGATKLYPGDECDVCCLPYPITFTAYAFDVYLAFDRWINYHRHYRAGKIREDIEHAWRGLASAATPEALLEALLWASHVAHYTGPILVRDWVSMAYEVIDDVSNGIAQVYPDFKEELEAIMEENWFKEVRHA